MVKLIWTEIALEDLRLIHEYISKDSKIYAVPAAIGILAYLFLYINFKQAA